MELQKCVRTLHFQNYFTFLYWIGTKLCKNVLGTLRPVENCHSEYSSDKKNAQDSKVFTILWYLFSQKFPNLHRKCPQRLVKLLSMFKTVEQLFKSSLLSDAFFSFTFN